MNQFADINRFCAIDRSSKASTPAAEACQWDPGQIPRPWETKVPGTGTLC